MSNKLIAEFMGEQTTLITEKDSNGNTVNQSIGYNIHNLEKYKYTFKIEQLKYSTSWNWLMPVISKIDKTMLNESIQFTTGEELANDLFRNLRQVDINLSFKQVVRWINWYDKQKEGK